MDDELKALYAKWTNSVRPSKEVIIELGLLLNQFDGAKSLLKVATASENNMWKPSRWVKILSFKGLDTSKLESLLGMTSEIRPIPEPEVAPVAAFVQVAEDETAESGDSPDPAAVTATQSPSVRVPRRLARQEVQEKPAAASGLSGVLGFAKKFLPKKAAVTQEVTPAKSAEEGNSFSKLMKNKNVVLGVGIAVLLLILAVVAWSMFGNGSGSSYDPYSDPYSDFGPSDFPSDSADPGFSNTESPDSNSNNGEVAPRLENPIPLDFVSTPWLKGLQALIFVELLGVLLSVGGDAKFRQQWVDSFVAVACALATVFIAVPAGIPIGFAVIPLIAVLVIVALVTFMGGRDFSPMAAYFLIVGIVGGLIVNKIGLLQGVVDIQSAPVLPMVQIGVLFQLKNWDAMWFPILVYCVIIIGLGFSVFEGLRPSEDKTSRWGTVTAAVIGLVVYFALLYLLGLAAWICYIVAFSSSIGFASLTQNERAIRVITDKWGVRSSFDGAMIVTAVLLLIQIITGTVGLF